LLKREARAFALVFLKPSEAMSAKNIFGVKVAALAAK
jgi:hypothetical protein